MPPPAKSSSKEAVPPAKSSSKELVPPTKLSSQESLGPDGKKKTDGKKKASFLQGGNWVNVAVLAAVAAVFAASWLLKLMGPTLAELDEAHPTLLTPASDVWYAWIVVFAYEAVFVVAQLLPMYSSKAIVLAATPWCVVAWLVQMYFVVETSRDDATNSTFAVISIMIVMLLMFGLLLTMDSKKPTFSQYWLLRAPFSLHAGWIMVVASVNVNLYVDYQEFRMPAKFAVAVICLVFMFALTFLFSLTTRRPDPIIAMPVAWGTYWMYQHSLYTSLKGSDATLDASVIDGVGFAALQVSIGAVWLSALALLARFVVCCKDDAKGRAFKKSKSEQELEEAVARNAQRSVEL